MRQAAHNLQQIGTKTKRRIKREDIMKTIRARFIQGVFEPLEKIEYPEGEELNICIDDKKLKKFSTLEALRATAGSWKDLIDCDQLIKDIYESRKISTRSIPKL